MKILRFISDNILFIITLFLLAFIPLYPKLPIVGVSHTWVYIRLEDFLVAGAVIIWIIQIIRKKATFKTPLTLPIMIFWIIGAIATIHGVVIIFPSIANVFPNVAFLNFLRHIEYMSLFFVAFAGLRDKRSLPIIITVLAITLLVVFVYGIGQKYASFPAYLTMNEEFAKGIRITLSPLSRVPSTFGGHYDLAAYLVLIIPVLASVFFGVRNYLVKAALLGTIVAGFLLLFMTVSRVSFFVLLVTLVVVLFLHKKRFVIFSLPIAVVFVFLFFTLEPSLFSRFGNSIREVNVLVNANTGEVIGHVNFVPSKYFKDKIIRQKYLQDQSKINLSGVGKQDYLAEASPSAIVPLKLLPQEIPLVVATNISTGENLPQGTGYVNLSLSPVTKRLKNFFYEQAPDLSATTSAQVFIFNGDFLIKRAAAYDLSFTTRFQGEWPNAIKAFQKNILVGSGYGSVSLAVDNNYFRMLGETGLLGIASFFAIFLSLGIYIKRILPNVDSNLARSFVLGFVASVIGLALNAMLIDVFEASKIAFLLWLLVGVTLGTLSLYQTKHIDLLKELKNATTSTFAIILYLFIATLVIFSGVLSIFFVGDDFTWFRWAGDCNNCILSYFTDSDGFFYRPGTKVYFNLMHSVFWLNQVPYHAVSIFLHFIVTALFFLLAKRVLKSTLYATLSSFLLLIASGYSEVVFWISGTGHLFNAALILLALLLFIFWEEKKKVYYYAFSLICIVLSLLFHELGVVTPILIVVYKITHDQSFKIKTAFRKLSYVAIFAPIPIYLLARFAAQSHWFSGDYSYDLLKLPFNIVGNITGYLMLALFGPMSLPIYQIFRGVMREQILLSLVLTPLILFAFFVLYRTFVRGMEREEKEIIIFGFLFFTISLLPFLGLGNIAPRYSYLASLGLILIFVILVKKLYIYLQNFGRDIAISSIIAAIALFSLAHIIQVQQNYTDWNGAGEKSKKFFLAIDGLYTDNWSSEVAELHFVNVPIRNGEAWVFPVGLSDAVWFAFKNEHLKVFKHPTVSDALALAGDSSSKRIFVFQEDGSLKEVIRPKNSHP